MTAVLKRLRANPAVRNMGIPLYQLALRGIAFLPPPRILANSMPKAGTHLLISLLDQLPRTLYSGVHYSLNEFRGGREGGTLEKDRLRTTLDRVRNGQYMTAHFPADPVVVALLASLEYRSVFIVRDPRDIVVSQAFYIMKLKRHHLHNLFMHEMSSFSERIMALIEGTETGTRRHPSIGQRLRDHAGWLEDPGTLVVRFEDLVGRRGGGSDEVQHSVIRAVAHHILRPLTDEQLFIVAGCVHTNRSATFRKGVIGEWRSHFTSQHVEAFKRMGSRELVAYGYEASSDWEV